MTPNSDLDLQWGGELIKERFLEEVTFNKTWNRSYKSVESSEDQNVLGGENMYQTWEVKRYKKYWLWHGV